MRLVVSLAIALLTPAPPPSPVLYVDAGAPAGGDGSSWTAAFSDLQTALAAASSGTAIFVAEGIYRPGAEDRAATFRLRSGVALYGGFAGGERSLAERGDPGRRPSVLSGDLGIPGDPADNAYHVVTADGVDGTAVLDGFVVTGANGDGAVPRNRGGGIRNVGGHPTIRRTAVVGNVVRSHGRRAGFGAGMFNDAGARPSLTNVLFRDNRAEGASGGGGMANKGGSAPRLVDVAFVDNAAGFLGGGMTSDGGSAPSLRRVVFDGNRAVYSGGMDNMDAHPVLRQVVFTGNTAEEYGGGMTNDDGSTPLLVQVVFVGNTAGNATKPGGGALHNDDSTPTLVGVVAAGNAAARGAGGVYSVGPGTPVLRDVVLRDNAGGALHGPARTRRLVTDD